MRCFIDRNKGTVASLPFLIKTFFLYPPTDLLQQQQHPASDDPTHTPEQNDTHTYRNPFQGEGNLRNCIPTKRLCDGRIS
mmetsp:Transcript_47538/g.115823  ORF Transcript_47538/g.115823 Transcript_47538/m.115823 type:complete len:80 (+) Transcript_47538:95-334(+)